MSPHLQLPAEKVLQKNGKSFQFATLFFTRQQLHKIASLYQVCRYIDDVADENPAPLALPQLLQVQQDLLDTTRSSALQEKIKILTQWGIERQHLLELVAGAQFDLQGDSIRTREQFFLYCYRVAGVVGLMMCPLLGCRDPRGQSYAIQLGIGMQITNICRDVLADAQMGRWYFSEERYQILGVELGQLQSGPTPVALKNLVQEYLMIADRHYFTGYRGLAFLPLRSRLCILVAGEVYRHIGVKIRRNQFDVLAGRTYLSYWEKLAVALGALRWLLKPDFWSKPVQDCEWIPEIA